MAMVNHPTNWAIYIHSKLYTKIESRDNGTKDVQKQEPFRPLGHLVSRRWCEISRCFSKVIW
jgi:hypothetical protein